MRSCRSSPRCWTGPELSKQKPTRNKESTEHSAYASFFPPFASGAVDSETLVANTSLGIEAPGGRVPVLNRGRPCSGNEDRTNITLHSRAFPRALSFYCAFFKFSFTH